MAIVALAFPAAALAASGGGEDGGGEQVAGARAVDATALRGPADRLHRSIEAFAAQKRVEWQRAERIAAARKKAREKREAFAELPGGVSIETLTAIAECESGGDPTIVSAGGSYRGKYQFSVSTWESVGGSGDPAAAPEAEQDYRAALLYVRSGLNPWPVCG